MNPPPVRFDANWHYRGLRALLLENSLLRLVILPELGGKLWSLVFKPLDREIFWQNPRTPPRPAPYGAAYDDWFSGGWDELFPNDAPVTVEGDAYPDHGEWWAMPFEWEVTVREAHEVCVHLWRAGVVTNTTVERWITLRAGESHFTTRYRLHNAGPRALDFLWKLHPALAIARGSRIDLPPCSVQPEASFNARLSPQPFAWPLGHSIGGGTLDMRAVPGPEAATYDFFYATDLAGGWCAVTEPPAAGEPSLGSSGSSGLASRPNSGVGFGMAFDPALLRSVWVFGAYSGWRGHYVTILEPCTGYPYALDTAIAQGTASRLGAGETIETSVTAVVYTGRSEVTEITREGEVR
jgi:hypothetical protein